MQCRAGWLLDRHSTIMHFVTGKGLWRQVWRKWLGVGGWRIGGDQRRQGRERMSFKAKAL